MENRKRCKCGGRVEKLKEITSTYTDGCSERLEICQCNKCFQIYKIRWQWDIGCGYDDIWLKPGEEDRGYSFPLDEYKKVLEEFGMTEKGLKVARWNKYVKEMFELAEELCEKAYEFFSEVDTAYMEDNKWFSSRDLLRKSDLSRLLALHLREDLRDISDSLAFIDEKLGGEGSVKGK